MNLGWSQKKLSRVERGIEVAATFMVQKWVHRLLQTCSHGEGQPTWTSSISFFWPRLGLGSSVIKHLGKWRPGGEGSVGCRPSPWIPALSPGLPLQWEVGLLFPTDSDPWGCTYKSCLVSSQTLKVSPFQGPWYVTLWFYFSLNSNGHGEQVCGYWIKWINKHLSK